MPHHPSDSAALRTFLDDRRSLVALACSIVENQSVAEELVQESWLRWHEKDYPAKDARYIFRRIVSNLSLDWGRRRSREYALLKEQAHTVQYAPSTEQIVIAREDLIQVIRSLQQLPRRSVTAFRLHMFSGKTYAQIGTKLGISRSRAYELVEDTLVHLAMTIDT